MEVYSAESSAPYCIRWTYGGYSAFGCASSPTVEMLSMSFLPTSTELYVTTTATETVTEAPTGTGTALPGTENGQQSCENKHVAAIVGGVVGAVAVLLAGALVLVLLLNRGKKQPQPQPPPTTYAVAGKSDGQYPPQPVYVPQPPAPVMMGEGEFPHRY
jgi:hypothetical protein